MLAKPIPVRFSETVDAKIGRIAEANGMTKAEIIRLAVDRAIAEIEHSGRIEVLQVVNSPSSINVGSVKGGKVRITQKKQIVINVHNHYGYTKGPTMISPAEWSGMTTAQKKDAMDNMSPEEYDQFFGGGKPKATAHGFDTQVLSNARYSIPAIAMSFWAVGVILFVLALVGFMSEYDPAPEANNFILITSVISLLLSAQLWVGMGFGLMYLSKIAHHSSG